MGIRSYLLILNVPANVEELQENLQKDWPKIEIKKSSSQENEFDILLSWKFPLGKDYLFGELYADYKTISIPTLCSLTACIKLAIWMLKKTPLSESLILSIGDDFIQIKQNTSEQEVMKGAAKIGVGYYIWL